MYYRKNDSRMGDEIFAMGLLLAPFVWKLVKGGYKKIHEKQIEFDGLSKEEQSVKKLKMLKVGENLSKGLIVLALILGLFSVVKGEFEFSRIVSIASFIIVYIVLKEGRKKYEVDSKAIIE